MMKNIQVILLLLLTAVQQTLAYTNAAKIYRSDVLSSTLITKVTQDDYGYVWIATEYGLNRFDGYTFHTYYNMADRVSSLADDHVHNVVYTGRDDLWICSSRLQRYNPLLDNFENVDCDGAKVAIEDVTCAPDSSLYAVSDRGVIYRINREEHALVKWEEASRLTEGRRTLFIRCESDGRTFWVGGQSGLIRFDRVTLKSVSYGRDELGHNQATGALLTSDGELYIHTPANVCRYDRENDRFRSLTFGHGSGFKSIRCLAEGRDHTLLVGTFGVGGYYYHTREQKAEHIPLKVNYFDISNVNLSSLFCDHNGNLWVGCFQKGVVQIPRQQNSFVEVDNRSLTFDNHYPLSLLADAGEGEIWLGQGNNGLHLIASDGTLLKHYLPYTTPISMHRDAKGQLWVGLYDEGAGVLDTKTGDFRKLSGFLNKRVRAIDEDPEGNLYFAMFNYGIHSFNIHTGAENILPDSVNTYQVMTLFVDSRRLLWIGSYEGIKCYRPNTKQILSLADKGGPVGVLVNKMAEDPRGRIWMATSDGLYRYDFTSHTYMHLGKEQGMPEDMICDVQVVSGNEIWFTTYKSLVCYDDDTEQFTVYRKGDGLTGLAFLRSVGTSTADGRLFFAFDDGYIHFDPKRIDEVEPLQPVRVSAIQLPFYQYDSAVDSLRISAFGMERDGKLSLKHHEKVVLLRFLSTDRLGNDNLCIQYRLRNGSSTRWITCSEGDNSVQLGPLSPGHYRLEVRSVLNGVSSPLRRYEIEVAQPWYATWWMKMVYILLVVLFVWQFFVGYRNYHVRINNEQRLKFFIDLTHELRSPTTLMLAPLQELLRKPWDEETGRLLRGIYRNGTRLLQLLNQILDVRKIDKGRMYIRCSETNLVEYVRDIFRVFDYEAQKRNITFRFTALDEELPLYIDRAHFDKVIYNLLTNAFKFVPDGGEIQVALRRVDTVHGPQAEICVTDNGRGIDQEQVDKVFERFYQAPSNKNATRVGFGIGLNLCYNIVKLHHGTITAGNRDDGRSGAVFTIRIPMGNAHLSSSELLRGESAIVSTDPVRRLMAQRYEAEEAPNVPARRSSHTILVADDDTELLDYLKRVLLAHYRVLTCVNGAEALNLTIQKVPDLVISDIQMPELDGFSLLSRLKSNNVTSHIPVILLTSLSEHEQKIAGLQKGADAYLEKPFDIEELLARVQGLIATRTKLRGKFTGDQDQQGKVEKVVLQGANERLMESVMKVINEHFSNPDLNVEFLADKVGLSRTQLHRRIKEITGIPCGDFIRNFRMQQAARLLEEGDVYVSQICYAVGFSNPTHFSTAFKRHFGVTPSEYVANKHNS